MEPKDMVKELWSLANIVTGFSVAQSIAFSFALSKKDLIDLQIETIKVKIVLTIIIIIFAAIYSYGVFRCYQLAMSIDRTSDRIWLQVTYGRLASIWLFTLVPVFGLFAKNIFGL